jgi:aminoglycoside phosphotransferase family enzyme/predicted kinase
MPTPSEDLVAGLLRPEAYPWRPRSVELVETHISWVFLAGNRVVKVKRPVVYPFVDHRSLASRQQSCLDEVCLNRRLTEGVYLGVVPIVATGGNCRVLLEETGTREEPVEWATLMRRLPARGMLDLLLAEGGAPANLADRLAARLIPFHRDLAARCEGTADELAAMVTDIVLDNLDELASFAGMPLGSAQLELVSRAMRRFISAHHALLRERVASGWIREGHGDLRAEHVCFDETETVQIFDCVEFNRDVRCADVASDLVYLLMDLTELGARAVARGLLERYRGAGIGLPDDLLRFYGGHRALVRVKIACLRLADAGSAERVAVTQTTADYLAMASAAALTVRPALIVMTGLSGTGKSTVANAIARSLDLPRLATDQVRKELASSEALPVGAWREGLYAPERTDKVYAELLARGDASLTSGKGVVLDGTFLAPRWREEAARLAQRHGVPLVLAETICDEDVVARRLQARQVGAASPSDATWETYRRQKELLAAAPPPVPSGAAHVVIDTSPEGPADLGPLLRALERETVIEATIPASAWL